MVVKLTDKESKIIKMRYKGFKNKEIAIALNVSEANVSQTLSRIAKRIISIQDTLELMSRIGIIERDAEIRLTESGQALLARWRQARPSRLNKLKRVSYVQMTQGEELEIVNREELVGYTSTRKATEKNVGTSLKEIAEWLKLLSDKLGDTYMLKTSTQEKKPVKPTEKKPYDVYIQ